MHRPQLQVQIFHRDVLNQPTSPAEPQLRNPELRARLIIEEAIETACALVGTARAQTVVQVQLHEIIQKLTREKRTEPNLIDAIDGICDNLVVNYGTAEDIGVDIEPFYIEVMDANNRKADGPTDASGKRLKPPGWVPPDIKGVLECMVSRERTKRERVERLSDYEVLLEQVRTIHMSDRDRLMQALDFSYGQLACTTNHKPSRWAFWMIASNRGIGVDEFEKWAKDKEWRKE
jgi:predicted HAD superfamily Cof-like phosphohydrolase